MLTNNTQYIASFAAPVRSMKTIMYCRDDAGALHDIYDEDEIISINYERVGNGSKFFGYGFCQKMNVHLMDKERALSFATDNYFQTFFGTASGVIQISPRMYVSEVHRDEVTNELSITSYDKVYQMGNATVSELEITENMTLGMYAATAAAHYGLTISIIGDNTPFSTTYEELANLDGTETIRELFDSIAEATQSIYYIAPNDTLVFKQLDRDGAPVYTIDKEQYFSLDSSTNRRLAALCHTTQLGDAITASMEQSGTTQYLRDNPFYELRTDTHTLLDAALARVGGLTINQFECEWRGNPCVEIGDKIALIDKDGATVVSYLLDDSISYDGSYKQLTRWQYEDDNSETAENPTNLGDALYKTFAQVDKVNQQIDIVAAQAQSNTSNIAAIQLNTESILASVSKIEENVDETIQGVNGEIETLTNKVEAAMTAEGVKISIQEELAKGVDKVYTSTGFSFDADGLRVTKTGSEMESLLDEDGLKVFRDNTEVLTADNTGVNGINMTIRQYLYVGGSRFEAYGAGRTGCFWIG